MRADGCQRSAKASWLAKGRPALSVKSPNAPARTPSFACQSIQNLCTWCWFPPLPLMGTAATARASSSYPCVVTRDAAINHNNNAKRQSVPLRCSCLFPLPNMSWARVLRLNCILWNFGESSTLIAGNEVSQCSVHCAVSRLNRATPGRGQLKDSIAASFALILTISSLPIHTFKRRKLSNGTWNACSDFCRFGSSLRYARPFPEIFARWMMMIITNRPADGRHVLATFGWLAALPIGPRCRRSFVYDRNRLTR